jgi:hypothetical protein
MAYKITKNGYTLMNMLYTAFDYFLINENPKMLLMKPA